MLTFSGHPDRALGRDSRDIASGDQRTSVVRAIAAALALAPTGQTAEAVAVAEAGFTDHAALGDELAIAHPAIHIVNQVFALTEAGRLAEAEQLARAGADIVAANRVPVAQIWFAANLGRVATSGPDSHRPPLLCGGGRARGGQPASPARGAWPCRAWRWRSPCWASRPRPQGAAGAGKPAGVRIQRTRTRTRRRLGRCRSRRPGDAASGSGTLPPGRGDRAPDHRVVDLARPDACQRAGRLGQAREMAGACDSPLVSARARHAAAARARDARELTRAADDFEALGAVLLAAEAASSAAEAFSRARDQRAATAARRRSSALAAACEGASTPALFHAARRGIPALGTRTRDCHACGSGPGQQGHRRSPLPVRADSEQSLAARLCQARRHQSCRLGPSPGD